MVIVVDDAVKHPMTISDVQSEFRSEGVTCDIDHQPGLPIKLLVKGHQSDIAKVMFNLFVKDASKETKSKRTEWLTEMYDEEIEAEYNRRFESATHISDEVSEFLK